MNLSAIVRSAVSILLFSLFVSGCNGKTVLVLRLKCLTPPTTAGVKFLLERFDNGRMVALSEQTADSGGRPCNGNPAGCGAPWPGIEPGQYRISVQFSGARYFYDASQETTRVADDSLHATIVRVAAGDSVKIRMILKPS